MLSSLVIISFFLHGVIICLRKWNIIPEYYQLHKRKWMPDWCTFCFSFWIGCALVGLQYEMTALTDVFAVSFYGLVVAAMVSLIERQTS